MNLRFVSALLVGVALAAGWGLLGGNRGEGEEDKTEIRFSFWGTYEEWQMWQQIKQEFEARNPNIAVKLEYWPAAYEDKVKVLLAADKAPDVMSMQDEPFQAYCTKGKFEDLTPYIRAAGDAYTPDKFLRTSLEAFQFHRTGRQMGLPWDGGMVLVFYNKKLFREAGVPYPDGSWTWDEPSTGSGRSFLEVCKKLTKDKDGDGRIDQFGCELTSWWGYTEIFVWGAGGNFLNTELVGYAAQGPPPKGNWEIGKLGKLKSPSLTSQFPSFPVSQLPPEGIRCILNTPEAIRGLQFYQDLRFKHHVAPTPAEAAMMEQDVLFLTGRIAMRFNGPWGMPFLRQTKLDWDIAPMPMGPAGRVTRVSWDGLAMFKGSKHKKEAWKLIEFITGERGQTIIAQSGRAIPARKSIAYSPAFTRPDTPQHEEFFLDGLSYMRVQPITELWSEMDPIMQRETDKLLLGVQDAATTVRVIEQEVNKIFRSGGLLHERTEP